ncbi:MAG TPA: CoA pyrophosphatase [Anaerolineales bacterium]|nr:CoA pyrophosphatase [Anaerolineales bacterium]
MLHPDLSPEEISKRLQEARSDVSDEFSLFPVDLFSQPPRQAAVLIPFLIDHGVWHVLFTRRTASLPEHSGQVAFPGGRADTEDDSPSMTALREAEEEIGIRPEHVKILGMLRRIRTISNYCVTPVVGSILWPYPLRLASDEVSRAFTIPLAWLANPENHAIQLRALPAPYSPVPVIYFKHFDGELLWGVSAQIVLILLRALRI